MKKAPYKPRRIRITTHLRRVPVPENKPKSIMAQASRAYRALLAKFQSHKP